MDTGLQLYQFIPPICLEYPGACTYEGTSLLGFQYRQLHPQTRKPTDIEAIPCQEANRVVHRPLDKDQFLHCSLCG